MYDHVWMKDCLINLAAYADRHNMSEVHDQICDVIEELFLTGVYASKGCAPESFNVINLSERPPTIT